MKFKKKNLTCTVFDERMDGRTQRQTDAQIETSMLTSV